MSIIRRHWFPTAVTLIVAAILVSVVASSVHPPSTKSSPLATTSQPRDCDSRAILRCGAYSIDEFRHKVQYGDGRNDPASLAQIYAIDTPPIFGDNWQVGTVLPNGQVVVGGQVLDTATMLVDRDSACGTPIGDPGHALLWIHDLSSQLIRTPQSAFVMEEATGLTASQPIVTIAILMANGDLVWFPSGSVRYPSTTPAACGRGAPV